MLPSLKIRTLDKAFSRAKDGPCSSSDDIVAAREHQTSKARNPTFDTPFSTRLFQLLLSKRQERGHNMQRKLQQHKFNLGNGAFVPNVRNYKSTAPATFSCNLDRVLSRHMQTHDCDLLHHCSLQARRRRANVLDTSYI